MRPTGRRTAPANPPQRQKRTLFGVTTVFVALLLVVAVLVIRANLVSVSLHHSRLEQDRLVLTAGDDEPLRVVIDPARRIEGATVTLDGVNAPHPAGDDDGELLWDPSDLETGTYQLRVEVPRPTWFSAVTDLTVVIVDPGDTPSP